MQERQLELIKTSIFKIDLKENSITEIALPEEESNFYKYIRGSINEVSLANGGRKFKLRSNNTEVVNVITELFKSNELQFDETIPTRLLRAETNIQETIERLGKEMSEGLLIISLIEDRGIFKAVLCKVEDVQFIDKVSFSLNSGYPLKRRIFRSVQFIFNDQKEIIDVVVHDLNSKGATYWWDTFLELDQLWDDIYNTKTAFNIIDTKVLSKIKKESQPDHTYLRNSIIRYFRTNQEFNIEKLIETCFEGYQPVSAKIDVESMKDSIKKLPEKFNFDERFDLKPSEITAKIKYSINLTDNIDLVIKDEINIESTITPEIHHQKKYLRIRSDAGYDAFKK